MNAEDSLADGSVRARWVFPVEGPPVECGVVRFAGGRIVEVFAGNDPRAVDLGNVAIIPGLVNAHTHLELSDVERPLGPAAPFTAWLKSVVGHRRAREGKENAGGESPVARGIRECLVAGTTLAGDIVSPGWDASVLPSARPHIVAFQEALGLLPERREEQVRLARQHVEVSQGEKETTGASRWSSPGHPICTCGISPHAPYSVHPDLYRELIGVARAKQVPVAVHLAETRGELELLEHGTGEFVEFLGGLGVWRDGLIPRGSKPLDYLRPLAEVKRGLVIHGNYLNPAEVDFLAEQSNLAVAYCPRTHAYFGHEPHPWRTMQGRGITVALGTDSRASNPDLSVWKEVLFLRAARHPKVDPAVLLRMATLDGARALGTEEQMGSLVPGKWADLAVVKLPERDAGEGFSLLLDGDSRIEDVFIAGQRVPGRE